MMQQETAQLQQQNRMAQYRVQEQYVERLRQQQAYLQNDRHPDYDHDPYYSSAPIYQYNRGGNYYQTNQYQTTRAHAAIRTQTTATTAITSIAMPTTSTFARDFSADIKTATTGSINMAATPMAPTPCLTLSCHRFLDFSRSTDMPARRAQLAWSVLTIPQGC
jgi:hypothetical protein